MKQKVELLLIIMALAFAGCGSDRNKNNDRDTLMTDSAVMDTATVVPNPADTMVKIDSTVQDTSLIID